MLYDLSSESDRGRFLERVKSLLDGGKRVRMDEVRSCRSMSQNKYLHTILRYFGMEFGYGVDEVKLDIFKRICNPDLFADVRLDNRGVERVCWRSVRDLSSDEMTTAIRRFRNYSAAQGLYIPEPGEDSLFYVEQINEQNKNF